MEYRLSFWGKQVCILISFTRPEFISFRQLCTELNKPKQQVYLNFIGLIDGKVPIHTALSHFHMTLGIQKGLKDTVEDEQVIDAINRIFVNQAKQLDDFLHLMLESLDSRPVLAKVGGFKKESTCKTSDNCTCKVHFCDSAAKAGRQRTKVTYLNFLILTMKCKCLVMVVIKSIVSLVLAMGCVIKNLVTPLKKNLNFGALSHRDQIYSKNYETFVSSSN